MIGRDQRGLRQARRIVGNPQPITRQALPTTGRRWRVTGKAWPNIREDLPTIG
jgi:hypothetical protein